MSLMLALGELQERVLSAQNVGGSQRRLQPIREQWLIARLSSALQCGAVNFTDHNTSENLPHRDEPHSAWIWQKRETVRSLAVFWDCTVTFALLVDFTAFSLSVVRYLTRASAGVWSRERTAVELRESRGTERWQRRRRRRGEFCGLWVLFSVVNSALRVLVEQQVDLWNSNALQQLASTTRKRSVCPVFVMLFLVNIIQTTLNSKIMNESTKVDYTS